MTALSDLDEDADGYIKTADLVSFMKTLAEPLDEEEMLGFTTMCREHDDSDKISIKKLAEIMIPDLKVENEMTRGTKHKDEVEEVEEVKVEKEEEVVV